MRFFALETGRRLPVLLKTKSLDTARTRRDALMETDDRYWAALTGIDEDAVGDAAPATQQQVLERP
ncbi:MAG: hypothetical protein AAF668_06425 [Pseudomonadota bacterium]